MDCRPNGNRRHEVIQRSLDRASVVGSQSVVNVLFLSFSYRHSFSEDTWVKFSNLSEDRIIGTHDATAHVSIV